jgi:hypothetical protein
MAVSIDKARAVTLLRSEAAAVKRGEEVDPDWRHKVEHLSSLCEAPGSSRTHVAFLCTAMLAKALEPRIDLYAIKPTHADGNHRAYSARSLCHSVIVPLSAELGFSIGVTGREPLNNQPYFRMTKLGDGTPVHSGAQQAFAYMVSLIDELSGDPPEVARAGLRAFIAVRRQYQPSYASDVENARTTPTRLLEAIRAFVAEDSEGGRRAQAIVAALLDVVMGEDRIESGRINDPSRKHPGDVCVRMPEDAGWEKAIEVRDKSVTAADVQVFGRKCLSMGVRDAAVVAASPAQQPLNIAALVAWAEGHGLGLTIFVGWDSLVDQALFWAGEAKIVAAGLAVAQVQKRLVAVEASPEGVVRWLSLVLDDE